MQLNSKVGLLKSYQEPLEILFNKDDNLKGVGWGLKFCILKKFPSDTDAAVPQTIIWAVKV